MPVDGDDSNVVWNDEPALPMISQSCENGEFPLDTDIDVPAEFPYWPENRLIKDAMGLDLYVPVDITESENITVIEYCTGEWVKWTDRITGFTILTPLYWSSQYSLGSPKPQFDFRETHTEDDVGRAIQQGKSLTKFISINVDPMWRVSDGPVLWGTRHGYYGIPILRRLKGQKGARIDGVLPATAGND